MQLNLPEPSEFPELSAGQVHVWAVPLDECEPRIAACESVLSQDERVRTGKFLLAPPRQTYVASRAALRVILGQYLGVAASSLKLVYDAFGKPQLDDGALSFNVAHSGKLTLIAVSREGRLGVDVELIRKVEASLEIAARNLHPQELAALRSTSAAELPGVFLRCWTRKEAILKNMGVGLGYPLDSFDVLTASSNNAPIELPPHASQAPSRYWLHDLDPSSEYRAALAANFASPLPLGFTYSLDRIEHSL